MEIKLKSIGVARIVKVKGLDVINDTLILDIKPYTPQYDASPEAKVPRWVKKLDY